MCCYCKKGLIKKCRNFFYLIKDILCHFAAQGKWPYYPSYMSSYVDEMSRHVFSLDDDSIKRYCQSFFDFKYCHRPFPMPGNL